jgi:hypothetical protein
MGYNINSNYIRNWLIYFIPNIITKYLSSKSCVNFLIKIDIQNRRNFERVYGIFPLIYFPFFARFMAWKQRKKSRIWHTRETGKPGKYWTASMYAAYGRPGIFVADCEKSCISFYSQHYRNLLPNIKMTNYNYQWPEKNIVLWYITTETKAYIKYLSIQRSYLFFNSSLYIMIVS